MLTNRELRLPTRATLTQNLAINLAINPALGIVNARTTCSKELHSGKLVPSNRLHAPNADMVSDGSSPWQVYMTRACQK